MGNKKRKQDSDSHEDLDHSASDSDAQSKQATKPKQLPSGKSKVSSKQKPAKKPKSDYSGDESPAHEGDKQPAIKVLKNADGEKYVDLGKKKRASVRSFKGQTFVDIREFYGIDGDEKPGKKGISLSIEQWEALKRSFSTIDSHFAEQGKK